MEPNDDATRLAYLDKLKNQILTDAENSSLDVVHRSRQDLTCVLLELNKIHNSKTAINRVIPDILYDIFTRVVYNTPFPGTAVLNLSRVCRHWRNLVLGWPSLWAFADIGVRSVIPLFLNRSWNAPLTLSWTTRYHVSLFDLTSDANSNPKSRNLYRSSKLYFESLASHILSRLSSLILHLTYSEFTEISHVFQNFHSSPLQLRSLDLGLYHNGTDVSNIPWTDFLPIDKSYLRELKLREVALPWFTPPHDKLTHFSIQFPKRPPYFTQLLTFLSGCPQLMELEIGLSDDAQEFFPAPEGLREAFEQILKTNELNFPDLRKLELAAMGQKSFDYIQCLTRLIKNMGSLSTFNLKYDYELIHPFPSGDAFNIFELVPAETFPHFAKHHYFCINLYRHSGNFTIHSGPGGSLPPSGVHLQASPGSTYRSRSNNHLSARQLFPLYISGLGKPGQLFDHTPILHLIRIMPEITHLELVSSAWELLTDWKVDINAMFPCLRILALTDHHHPVRDCAVVLNSIPSHHLKLRTLILKKVRVESSDVLLDVVLKIGVEVLELGEFYDDTEYRVVTTLRERGITVILPDEPVFNPL